MGNVEGFIMRNFRALYRSPYKVRMIKCRRLGGASSQNGGEVGVFLISCKSTG